MNEKALRILEYPKIIDMLTGYASSPMGKELCRNLVPSSDLSEILKGQMETSDALSRILKKGSLSFSGIRDIRGSLLRLKVGSTIGMPELLNIAATLDVALRAKSYGRRDSEDTDTDSLDSMFALIEPMSNLNHEIRRCIIDEETMADDASPTLKSIRRQIRLTNDRIHSQLASMVSSQNIGSKLQDNLVTMRNGRYCLPVKAEYRSQVQGMIHDQSSTGSTLFIEPMAIVKLNNDLRELGVKEKEEIEHILDTLSELAGESAVMLEQDIAVLTRLDFIFAKASLSKTYNGSEPVFNENGYINIKKGRHPLLDRRKVVPIDLTMGNDYHMLIVTGPNTGGKTVSLKTVGLFTLMGQAGLHIPAFDHSELAVFDDVFADIGDEQSIEQSLSTFSSHMTNIVKILEEASFRTLVLFDELCAGTDPTEGAALAIAILKYLLNRHVTTMATTHYSELKVFALSTDGVCNACCEFDVATLSPTYRLLIGIPGKSNAFAISGKLGLPEYIIEDARKNIDVQQQNFEDLLANLETSRATIEKEQEEITAYKAEIETLKKRLEEKRDNLSRQKERILNEANEKAQAILQEAKDYADQTIRTMNKLSQSGGVDMKAMEQERARLRDKMNHSASAKKTAPAKKNKHYSASDFRQGDSVHVLSLDLKGTVVSQPNSKGELTIQMGILKSRIHFSDLEPIDEEVISTPIVNKTGSGKIKMNKSANISTSINLIGETVDEAMIDLDKYLDDAYLSHIPNVTIIHGRGTGALRKAVHEKLRKSKYVKSYRLGTFGEGETGVTIVEFK
ncbi:MAG: endonuclease MutS2 [Coprococcus sp.]